MSSGYYMYALFITALICLIAIIFRLLFDNVRRQRKLLEAQEKKLLELYNSVETIMEEFTDQSTAAIEEMREIEIRAAAASARAGTIVPAETIAPAVQSLPPPVITPQIKPAPPASLTPAAPAAPVTKIDSSRIRAASEVLERAERMIKSSSQKIAETPAKVENGAVFHRIIEETTNLLPASVIESATQPRTTHTRILEMSNQGKTTAQIAKKLGITQNEVLLVVGLGKNMVGTHH